MNIRLGLIHAKLARKFGLPAEKRDVYLDDGTLNSIARAIPESYLRFLERVADAIRKPDFVRVNDTKTEVSLIRFTVEENKIVTHFVTLIRGASGWFYANYQQTTACSGTDIRRFIRA